MSDRRSGGDRSWYGDVFPGGDVHGGGATIVIAQNLDILLKGVSLTGGLFSSKLPAIRTAVAYPAAARGRTGLTIAMFSLIIFSVVLMGTMSENYEALYTGEKASAGWDVRADVNGTEVMSDFRAELQAAGVDTSDIVAIGTTTSPNREASQVRMAGAVEWKQWQVVGVDEGFLAHTELEFASARLVTQPMRRSGSAAHQENVAVIDALALQVDGGIGNDSSAFSLDGVKAVTRRSPRCRSSWSIVTASAHGDDHRRDQRGYQHAVRHLHRADDG
ncbi:MAG: hypothetical protein R2839_07940 [Thermomicrobiales bacterium]